MARLPRVLDRLALAFVGVAWLIDITGGIHTTIGGVPVSARSPDRAFLLAALLVVVRLIIDRHTPAPAFLRWLWARVYAHEADAIPSGSVGHRPTWRVRLLCGLGFVAFAAVMLHTQLAHLDAVPERGDPLFSVWRISWVFHQIAGDPRALFNANIFHPAPLTLTFSDSMLLPAVTTAPLLASGVHPVVAANIMLVSSFVASAFTCYLLVETLTKSSAAGFIAGLLFGFHPFHYDHYTHFELLMAYWIPLALLALHRFVETTKVRYAVAAAVFTAAQLYSSMYLAVLFLWIAAAVFGVLVRVLRPNPRQLLTGGLAAGILGLALAYPLGRTYTAAQLNERPFSEVATYSATPSDFLRAHPRSVFWGERTLGQPPAERALFPGLVILILAALAVRFPLGPVRIAYAAAVILAVELIRGANGLLYPVLYEYVPFMRGIRAPVRASLLLGLALAVLAGFAVRRILAGRTRAASAAIVLAITVAIGIDLQPSLELERVPAEPPAIYQALGGRQDLVLAEFPMGLSPGAGMTDTPHMYFSIWHWNQLVNGYSGHAPSGYGDFQAQMRTFPDTRSLDLLRGRGVTHVTVNCAMYHEGCEDLLKRVSTTSALREIAAVVWEGKPVKLYALER